MSPPTPYSGRPRKKGWKSANETNSGAATVATAGTAIAEVVSPGVAAAKLGETAEIVEVATTTTAAVAAAVVQVGQARRALMVAEDAAKGATRAKPIGVATAALGEAPEGGGTAHDVVQGGTARPPPPARLRTRTRTTARWPW